MQENDGRFGLPADGQSERAVDGEHAPQAPHEGGQPVEQVFERAQTLLRAGELAAARAEARASLESYGPHAGLYVIVGRAHAAENEDDHDKAADRAYRDGLDLFPDDLDLLAGYAEFGLAGDPLDEPGRVDQGAAAAARVKELAPDSPQAQRLAQAGRSGAKMRGPAAVQRYDARVALTGGVDVRAAAAQAAQAAAGWPYDRRLAVRAETLAALARPTAALARTRVRAPQLHALIAALLGAAVFLGVPALHLPQPLTIVAALFLLPTLQELALLRRARDRAEARIPADFRAPAPGAPDLPRTPKRERLTGALALVVALGSLAGSTVWHEARAAEYPRYEASVPESFHGIPLSNGDVVSEAMEAQMDSLPRPPGARTFSALYQDDNAHVAFLLVGGTGDLHKEEPDDMFTTLSSGFSVWGEPTESWTAEPGQLGGRMECAKYESGMRVFTLCMWLDKGSFGIVATPADADHVSLPHFTRELREATLHPTDRGAA